VVRETQYFGAPFEPGVSRRQWTEPMDGGGLPGEAPPGGDEGWAVT